MSAAKLIEDAETFMDRCEFEQAETSLNRALELEPHNTQAMDFLAELLVEGGNKDRAKDIST